MFDVAKQKGLEGILAKRRNSVYEERRTREWLKIKITQTVDCVIGGYTDPEGSREYFGSIVLGLYDKNGNLIHVGQAGTGFDHAMLKEISKVLKKRETKVSPFPKVWKHYEPCTGSSLNWWRKSNSPNGLTKPRKAE